MFQKGLKYVIQEDKNTFKIKGKQMRQGENKRKFRVRNEV